MAMFTVTNPCPLCYGEGMKVKCTDCHTVGCTVCYAKYGDGYPSIGKIGPSLCEQCEKVTETVQL